MGQTLRFRLGPFPVSVEPSFFIVSLVLAANRLVRPAMLLEWVVVVFVSVLVHELGHAVAARAFGLPARISLHGAGGTTHHQPPERDSTRQHILISLAGPAAGFLLGALAWIWSSVNPLHWSDSLAAHVQRDLIWANLGWGAVNLLPILPLDGGQVMQRLLVASSPERGPQLARRASLAVAVVVAIVALTQGWVWALFLFGWLAALSGREIEEERRVPSGRPGAVPAAPVAPIVEEATAALDAGRDAEALALARAGLAQTSDDATRARLAHLLGRAALKVGDHQAALESLGRYPDRYPAPPLWHGSVLAGVGRHEEAIPFLRRALDEASGIDVGPQIQALGAALFFSGHFDQAATLFQDAFQAHGDAIYAYNLACSWARAGHPDDAMEALRWAVEAGWSDLQALLTDEDFRTLRDRPDWPPQRR